MFGDHQIAELSGENVRCGRHMELNTSLEEGTEVLLGGELAQQPSLLLAKEKYLYISQLPSSGRQHWHGI